MLQYPDRLTTYHIQRTNAKNIFREIYIHSISQSHKLTLFEKNRLKNEKKKTKMHKHRIYIIIV